MLHLTLPQNKLLRIYKHTNHIVWQNRFPSLARQDFRDCVGSESHMLTTLAEIKTKDCTKLQTGEED